MAQRPVPAATLPLLVFALLLAGPAGALALASEPGSADRGWAVAIATPPEGDAVVVAGRGLQASGLMDYATASLDPATGEVRWLARYDGPARALDWSVRAAALPRQGPVVVTGVAMGDGVQEYATVAYDPASGEQRWEARYHGPRPHASWSVGQDVAGSPDGDAVYVTGLALPEGTPADAVGFNIDTLAYDAATGAQRWVTSYNGPGNSEDWGYAMDVGPDGRVFVTGRSWGGAGTNWDYATLAFDAARGGADWVARYHGPGTLPVGAPYGVVTGDWAADVAAGADGRVYVTGRSWDDATNYDVATLAYDGATGTQAWAARRDGSASLEDAGYAVAVAPDGATVYVTGWTTALGSYDMLTLAYDAATGAERWLARWAAPGAAWSWDVGLSLGVDPGGARVYVAGWSLDATGTYAYRVLAYDAATGSLAWEAALPGRFANNVDIATRFNGPGNNLDTVALVASPDGARVVVAFTPDAAPGQNLLAVASLDAATGALQWLTHPQAPGAALPQEGMVPHASSHPAPPAPRESSADGAAGLLGALGIVALAAAARRRGLG